MSDESTPAAPWWAWASALMMATAMMAATAVLGIVIAWEGDRSELQEHRALFQARSLAAVAARNSPEKAQAYIDALTGARTDVAEAFVIGGGREDEFGISRGQAYVVAHSADLKGAELEARVAAGGHRDKTRADRYAHAVSGVEVEKREGRASPEFVLEREEVAGAALWSAQVPVLDDAGAAQGSAGFSLEARFPDAPIPWVLLLLLLGAAGAAGVAFKGSVPEEKRGAALRAMIGVVGAALLVLCFVHYGAQLGAQVDASAEAAAAALAAAQASGLSPEAAAAVVAYGDVSFTGAPSYLFGALGGVPTAATLGEQARALYGAGRVAVPLVSVGVALLVLLALSAFLVRLAVGLREETHAYAYVLPSMIGMVVLVFVPFGFGVGMSLFDNDARRYYFVGLANFAEILASGKSGDVSFYWTLFVTVLWTTLNVVLHVGVGLALALILKDPLLKFRGVYRVLLIVPWAVPNYITALIWKGMFNKEFGAVNLFLEKIQLLLGMEPSSIDWLGGSFLTAFTANLVTNTWLGFPFMMVVSLGALQSIPSSLYEAAEVDGASPWQQFRHITLPLLKPALFPAIILGSIWTFNMFNVIYLVSGGGPNNSTEILITDAYRAFDVLGRYGFAAAYSVLIFVILFLYTVLTNRVTQATEGAFE